jgi:hypothetical protein
MTSAIIPTITMTLTRDRTTAGCSSNIVDASWQALADSMEYALIAA